MWKTKITIKPYFKWYDLWIGFYIELYKNPGYGYPGGGWTIFLGYFPMLGIKINKDYEYILEK